LFQATKHLILGGGRDDEPKGERERRKKII